jgi:hypothetical protein
MQLRVGGTLAVSVVLASLVIARQAGATEQDVFSRRIGKSAAVSSDDIVLRSKGACVCRSSIITPLVGAAGVLRRTPLTVSGLTRIRVDCWVPAFDAAGAQAGASACDDFLVLPK